MAGKITHIEVLGQVAKHLGHGTPEQREIAYLLGHPNYSKYANFGAIAPDIFYYYHFLSPFRTEKSQLWGNILHHNNPFALAFHFLETLKDMEEGESRDKCLAFTFGFLCHLGVDIVTHPYIFYISGDFYNPDPKISTTAQINHLRVEFALDSYLLEFRWGMSPLKYDFLKYVDIRLKNNPHKMDPIIWAFWQNSLFKTYPKEFQKFYIGSQKKIIPGDLINDSYLGFLEFHNLLDSRSTFMRGFLKTVDFLTFKRLKSSVLVLPIKKEIDVRFMNDEKRPWYYPSDPQRVSRETFIELVNRSAETCFEIVTKSDFYLKGELDSSEYLGLYDGYNLDTGLRYKNIQSMMEFSPLN